MSKKTGSIKSSLRLAYGVLITNKKYQLSSDVAVEFEEWLAAYQIPFIVTTRFLSFHPVSIQFDRYRYNNDRTCPNKLIDLKRLTGTNLKYMRSL